MLTLLVLLRTIEFVRYMMLMMIGSADEIKNVKFDSGPAAEIAVQPCLLIKILITRQYYYLIITLPFKKYTERPILKDCLYL